MPLTTTRHMLADAQAKGYAVGAFNIENMEMAQAVIAAAEELGAPVILQTTPGTLRYAQLELYRAVAAALADNSPIPVAIHLDHGDSYDLALRAIRGGYTSVMIDGSRLAYEENIALTARVANIGAQNDIPVEGELGEIGGKEDGMGGGTGGYTDPEKAGEFVKRTGVSSLAVAIGTAHGVYDIVPKLDIAVLKKIRDAVDVPLVLHGASGLGDKAVRECIREGICKVNFATELRAAFTEGVRSCLAENPNIIDPKEYCAAGREKVRRAVKERIAVCGGYIIK
ncbi:MAG: class II fructose-bisphosphate aldolase [Oscillospiraceae bacterium]|nr:class II fructose-bisphosphate aldolase [Oscillospiraceae bacterium]